MPRPTRASPQPIAAAPRPRVRDRALFPHTLLGALGMALKIGEPAHRGVELYLDSFHVGPFLRPRLAALALDLRSGTTLDLALTRFPGLFPGWLVALVAWGCAAGQPAEALEEGAQILGRERLLVRAVRSGVLYPALVLILCGAYGLASPALQIAQPAEWCFSALCGVGVSVWIASFFPFRSIRYRWLRWLLAVVPGGAGAVRSGRAAVVARLLAFSLAANRPLAEALRYAAGVCAHHALAESLLAAAQRIETGENPRLALSQATGPSAPVLARMAGCLAAAAPSRELRALAHDLESEAALDATSLTQCITPLVTLLAGCAVGFTALHQAAALDVHLRATTALLRGAMN